MYKKNPILLTDGYKISHADQYPPGTENVFSYLESRGGKFDETVFFGLQYILKEYMQTKVTENDVEAAEKIINAYFGNDKIFNKKGWLRLLEKHDGRLPISIKAVPEGLPIPTHNVLMTVENTDPEFYWLTNYVETLLVQVWYPTTVATISREIKKLILKYLEKTGDPSLIDFKLHDFGFRGVSSVESAGIGGLAHLINFKGTDTLVPLLLAQEYYNVEGVAGFSIPAAEHSTITSWGREGEQDAYINMLQRYKTGFVAVVSDSYDIYGACKNLWGKPPLKDMVLNRDGVLVIRPDSGNPPEVVVNVINILMDTFGYERNSKGYKVLNPHVRVIQGDGVNYTSIGEILFNMEKHEQSADNVAFGMGGGLLQDLNRDTQKFAFKCSCVTINGMNRDVYKDPVTDPGKVSKKGRLKLVVVDGVHGPVYETIREDASLEESVLVEVFRDGKILKEYTLEEIRANTAKSVNYWNNPEYQAR